MIQYTQLRTTRHDLNDVVPLAKPYTILLEPSGFCNFRCVQCFQSAPGDRLKREMMTPATFDKILRDLTAWQGPPLKVLRFIGFGEPMVNRHYADMVAAAIDAGVAERYETTSNCSLLTRDVAERLVDAGMDYLRASVYAATRSRHRAITRRNMPPAQIVANLRTLQEVKRQRGSDRPFVYVKMLDSLDADENARFVDLYREVADEIAIEKPHGWLDDAPINGVDYSGAATKKCPQPFKMLSIRANGDVLACDPDWLGNTCVGNVLDESLEAIWHGDRLRAFQRMHVEGRRHENESCRRCRSFLTDSYTTDNVDRVTVEQIESGRAAA